MRNDLSKRQFALLAFFLPFVFKIAMLPSMLSAKLGQDAWLCVAFLLALELIQLALIVAVAKEGGMEKVKEKYGKPLCLALTLPLLFGYWMKSVVYAAEAINYVSTFLFYNTQKLNLAILFLLVATFLGLSGVNTLGRLSEILVWTLPAIVAVGLLFGEVRLHPEFVLPVGEVSAGRFFASAGEYVLWAFDLTPLMFCRLKEGKSASRPLIAIGGGCALLAVCGFYLLFTMNYGPSAPYIEHAFAALASFNVVNTEIGSIEWPGVTLWIASALSLFALKIYGAGRIGEGAGCNHRFGSVAFALAVLLASLFWIDNLEKGLNLGTSWLRFLVFGIEAAAPLIAFVALKTAKKREKKGGEETPGGEAHERRESARGGEGA